VLANDLHSIHFQVKNVYGLFREMKDGTTVYRVIVRKVLNGVDK